MLHGRESLKRLIGKRRRTPSSDLSQLLSPHQESTRGSKKEEDVVVKKEDCAVGEKEWVSCPVCGTSIRGDDFVVNTHLDACLARGTKRKMTQRSLLQFQFSKKSSNGFALDDKEHLKKDFEGICKYEAPTSNVPTSTDFSIARGAGRHFALEPSNNLSSSLGPCRESPFKREIVRDTIHNMGDSCGSGTSWTIKKSDQGNDAGEIGDFVVAFDTCIVGRRFHNAVDLQRGANVILIRDPQNCNDKHAIRVHYADYKCGETLGHLPRELSKHLSPLIDDLLIECEGTIGSVPENPHDAVPLHMICRKVVSAFGEKETVNVQSAENMWENLFNATRNTSSSLLNMPKYQRNFSMMVEDVMSHHCHLFDDQEKSFIGSFKSLSDGSQRLFIRLYTRKGPWFRVSKLSYAEIEDLKEAIEELHLADYIYSFHSSEEPFSYKITELLHLLNISELREIVDVKLSKKEANKYRKRELMDVFSSAYEKGKCPLLLKLIFKQVGPCIRISSIADVLFSRVQRLFFLNGEQDLSTFLLVDLGVTKFPSYTCNVSQQVFLSRSDLLKYEKAIEVAQILNESLDENDMEIVIRCIEVADNFLEISNREETYTSISYMPPKFFSRFSALWVYSKVLSLGVSVFEREHRYDDAIRLLKGLLSRCTQDCRRGYWILRLSVDLQHIGHINESLSVAEEGVTDPWVRAGSKVALQRRILRLAKPPRRWKIPIFAKFVDQNIKEVNIIGRPLNCELGTKNSFYGYDGERCGVEQLALQYYAEEGGQWQGVHTESGIWLTIFGLLMWDAMFCDIPDVFLSKFQIAPLDLRTDSFYESRKGLVEILLQNIREGMAEEMLLISWESHFGTTCQGVNWDRHSLSDLRAAVCCIGGQCLASLCHHLALDYDSWSSGMPDLLLWRFDDSGKGEAKLVEVKGPRDRLSEQQRAWLLVLLDCGFEVEVCKVKLSTKLES